MRRFVKFFSLLSLFIIIIAGCGEKTVENSGLEEYLTVSSAALPRTMPVGAPAYSDVCFSTRWSRPLQNEPEYDPFEVYEEFGANRIVWCYNTKGRDYIEKFRKLGCKSFGVAIHPGISDYPEQEEETYNEGRIKTYHGQPAGSKWNLPHIAHLGCANHPAFREVVSRWLKYYVEKGGADAVQTDDIWMNARVSLYYESCYCKYCMEGFRKWLKKNARPEQLELWNINNLDDFNYREYRNSQPNAEPPSSLHDFFVDFQVEATAAYYYDIKRQMDVYAGNDIPLSANAHRWSHERFKAIYDSFDFGIGELNSFEASPVYLYKVASEALERNKTQVWTLKAYDVPFYRKVLATTYAFGNHLIVPWDVYMAYQIPRLFARSEDFSDLYMFIRNNQDLFEGYEDACVVGAGLVDNRWDNFPPVVPENDDILVAVRAKPNQVDAPVIIHCVDWRSQPKAFALNINPNRFFPGRNMKVTFYSPGSKGKVISKNTSSCIVVPIVNPWGILKVEPAAEKSFLSAPVAVKPLRTGFMDETTLELAALDKNTVIRFTKDGTMPDKRSTVYQGPLTIDSDTNLVAKCFKEGRASKESLSLNFNRIKCHKAEDVTNRQNGLMYKYYEDITSVDQEIENLEPVKTGSVSSLNLNQRENPEKNHAVIFEGYLSVPHQSIYTFMLRSKDYCKIEVSGKAVLNNRDHKLRQLGTVGSEIGLEKGLHKIRIRYVFDGTTSGHPRAPFLLYFKYQDIPAYEVIKTDMLYYFNEKNNEYPPQI